MIRDEIFNDVQAYKWIIQKSIFWNFRFNNPSFKKYWMIHNGANIFFRNNKQPQVCYEYYSFFNVGLIIVIFQSEFL